METDLHNARYGITQRLPPVRREQIFVTEVKIPRFCRQCLVLHFLRLPT